MASAQRSNGARMAIGNITDGILRIAIVALPLQPSIKNNPQIAHISC
jgi:hypothetical protein